MRDIKVYLPDTIVSQWSKIRNENINLHIKTLKKSKMYKFETYSWSGKRKPESLGQGREMRHSQQTQDPMLI